jgi:hypothetical protein
VDLITGTKMTRVSWVRLSVLTAAFGLLVSTVACNEPKKRSPKAAPAPFPSPSPSKPTKDDDDKEDEDDEEVAALKALSDDEKDLLSDFGCKFQKDPEKVVAFSKLSSKDLDERFSSYRSRSDKKEEFKALKALLSEIDGDSDKAEDALKALCKKS